MLQVFCAAGFLYHQQLLNWHLSESVYFVDKDLRVAWLLTLQGAIETVSACDRCIIDLVQIDMFLFLI